MRHLPEVFAERVQEEHIRREDVPKGLLEPRPFKPRRRPNTALIAEACRRKYLERTGQLSEVIHKPRRRQKYAGLSSTTNRSRQRYANAEWVSVSTGLRVRKLSAGEIEEMQAHVQGLIDGKTTTPVRLDAA